MFPKSMDSISPQLIASTATTMQMGATVSILMSLLAQMIMKKSIKKIANLFLALQLAVYQQALSLSLPGVLEIMRDEFRNLIEFKYANAMFVIKMIYPEFQIDFLSSKKVNAMLSQDREHSIVDAFMVEITVAVVMIVGSVVFLLPAFIFKRKFVKRKLRKTKKALVWNGLLMTLMLTNFKHAMAASDTLKFYFQGEYVDMFELVPAITVLAILSLLVLFCFFFLVTHFDRLDIGSDRRKYGNLFMNQRMKHKSLSRIFRFPALLLHRLLIGVTLAALTMHGGLQLICLIQASLLYTCILMDSRNTPHSDDIVKKASKICCHAIVVWLLVFVIPTNSLEAQFHMCWVVVLIMLLMIIGNMVTIFQ